MHEEEIPWQITSVYFGQLRLSQDFVNMEGDVTEKLRIVVHTKSLTIIFCYRKYVWKNKKHAEGVYILKQGRYC